MVLQWPIFFIYVWLLFYIPDTAYQNHRNRWQISRSYWNQRQIFRWKYNILIWLSIVQWSDVHSSALLTAIQTKVGLRLIRTHRTGVTEDEPVPTGDYFQGHTLVFHFCCKIPKLLVWSLQEIFSQRKRRLVNGRYYGITNRDHVWYLRLFWSPTHLFKELV